MLKKVLLVPALVLLGVMSLPALKTSAQVAPTYSYFCHRSNSAKNPYQSVPFSQTYSEIDGQGNNDHTQHTGPIASSVVEALELKENKIDWGDIIPPVPGVLPNGYNWTSEGQSIWANDCNYNVESPVAYCDVVQATQLSKYEFQFNTTAVVENGPSIEGYSYDFGDGQTSGETNEAQVNHTYATEGTYSVVVTVTFNVYGSENEERGTVTDTCSTTVVIESDPQVLAATTNIPPQVTVQPTGAVSAGAGGGVDVASRAASMLGLVGSVAVLVYGLIRKLHA